MIIRFWICPPGTRERLQGIQLTSASLCLLREVLCATLHSVVSAHTVLHLSPLSSACSCASTSCRSSSHCVSWLSESSTSVLSANVLRRNTHFRLVLQRVACHQDIVVSFRLLSKLWRTPPVPTCLRQSLAVLCPLVLKRLLGRLDWFSLVRFRVAIVLAALYIDCTAVPADLHAQAFVITPVAHMHHVLLRLGHRSQVFQLLGQLASNHTRCIVDRIIRAKT